MAQGSFSEVDWNEEPSNKEKGYFALIMVLIVVLFMRWFWAPTMKKTKKMNAEYKNLIVQLDTLSKIEKMQTEKNIKIKTEHEKKITKVEQRFSSLLSKGVPSRQEAMSRLISEVATPRLLQNTKMNTLNFRTPVLKGSYSIVPFNMDLKGRFQDITSYIDSLENINVLMTVDNVALSTGADKRGVLSATLDSSLYVLPEVGMMPDVNEGNEKQTGSGTQTGVP